MPAIHVIGVDRPGLAALLAPRGLRVANDPGEAVAQLAHRPGACPTLVEASDAVRAADLLDAGADDVVLASDCDTLVAARLAALVRRALARGAPTVLRVGDLTIDTVAREASRGGRRLMLRPREYVLLLHLARHAGALVDRVALRRAVLGLGFDPGTNAVAVHMSRLRAELERGDAPMLVTERGQGYRLVVPPA